MPLRMFNMSRRIRSSRGGGRGSRKGTADMAAATVSREGVRGEACSPPPVSARLDRRGVQRAKKSGVEAASIECFYKITVEAKGGTAGAVSSEVQTQPTGLGIVRRWQRVVAEESLGCKGVRLPRSLARAGAATLQFEGRPVFWPRGWNGSPGPGVWESAGPRLRPSPCQGRVGALASIGVAYPSTISKLWRSPTRAIRRPGVKEKNGGPPPASRGCSTHRSRAASCTSEGGRSTGGAEARYLSPYLTYFPIWEEMFRHPASGSRAIEAPSLCVGKGRSLRDQSQPT
jgi:hypothetical protein